MAAKMTRLPIEIFAPWVIVSSNKIICLQTKSLQRITTFYNQGNKTWHSSVFHQAWKNILAGKNFHNSRVTQIRNNSSLLYGT